jgi:hypothetical protein
LPEGALLQLSAEASYNHPFPSLDIRSTSPLGSNTDRPWSAHEVEGNDFMVHWLVAGSNISKLVLLVVPADQSPITTTRPSVRTAFEFPVLPRFMLLVSVHSAEHHELKTSIAPRNMIDLFTFPP